MKKQNVFRMLGLMLSLALLLSAALPGIAAAPSESVQPTAIPEGGAAGQCGDDVTWTLDEAGKLTISGTGAMWDMQYDELPWQDYFTQVITVEIRPGVTRIGERTFASHYSISSVTIPDTVTSIGHFAFEYTYDLESITIPNSVTTIGNEVFRYSGLTSFTFPASVTSIGHHPFAACMSLSEINVEEGNPNYSSIDGILYDKNAETLIRCPSAKEGVYVVPDSVKRIDEDAFYQCRDLTLIILPEGLTSIGPWAFYFCVGLTIFTIPDSVTEIGEGAFYDCRYMQTITIPESVKEIKESCFARCDELRDVYYKGTESKWNAVTIGASNDPLQSASKHFGAAGPMYLRGDMDENFFITSDDAIYLLRHILLPDLYPISQSADVNGDGKDTSDDAVYLLRHVLYPYYYKLF